VESKNRYLSKEKSFRESYKVGKPCYEGTEILFPLLMTEIKDRISSLSHSGASALQLD